jgi:hypothetical protein
MNHTLGTAAAASGINKSTVLRAIKTGKISATRNEHGEWQIDSAELHGVYPPVAAHDGGNSAVPPHATTNAIALAEAREQTAAAQQRATADAIAFAVAREQATAAEQRLELRGLLEDMREQRDSWKRVAEAKLLAAPPKPWWQRLRSTG